VTEDLSFLAASPQMVRIRQTDLQIAPVDVPVFVCGESGVGKEVVAAHDPSPIERGIKRLSRSTARRCRRIAGIRSLFGFEQGAFTGAVRAKPGKNLSSPTKEQFSRRIAEMSVHLQAQTVARVARTISIRGLGADIWWKRTCACLRQPRGCARGDENGQIPRGFVLQAERAFHQCAATARADFGNSAAVQTLPWKNTAKVRKDPSDPSKHLLDAALNYPCRKSARTENFVKRYVILEDDEGSLRD